MTYLIYACEQRYMGLHGIYLWDIYDCTDDQDASDIGEEMSYDVMESYSYILSSFMEEAKAAAARDPDVDEDEYYNELVEENAMWNYWPLKNDKTLEEYKEIIKKEHLDYKDVIERYAK